MRDLYLRFKDAKEMTKTLVAFGFTKDEEQGNLYHPDVCLDIIGTIITTEETSTDAVEEAPVEDGEEVSADTETPEVAVTYVTEPGYHANVRVTNDELDLTALEKFAITPKTPARVWA